MNYLLKNGYVVSDIQQTQVLHANIRELIYISLFWINCGRYACVSFIYDSLRILSSFPLMTSS